MSRRKKTLTTQRGEVTWNQPVKHCRTCRCDFFPQARALEIEVEATCTPQVERKVVAASFLCSLCFLLFILFFVLVSIVTQLRRGEPRNTRNTRKVGKDNHPGLPVGRLRFPPVVLPPPARFRRRRSAPYGKVAGTLRRAVRRVTPSLNPDA